MIFTATLLINLAVNGLLIKGMVANNVHPTIIMVSITLVAMAIGITGSFIQVLHEKGNKQ